MKDWRWKFEFNPKIPPHCLQIFVTSEVTLYQGYANSSENLGAT